MTSAFPGMRTQAAVGLANSFSLTVGQIRTGDWAKVSGLTVKFEPMKYRSGLNNQVSLAGGLSQYENIKLTRAAQQQAGAGGVKIWLERYALNPMPELGMIYLYGPGSSRTPVMTWNLRNVVPLSWNVQDLDAGASKVALETLEIGHTGFIMDMIKSGG